MAADPKKLNPDLVRQEAGMGRMVGRELPKNPGKRPDFGNTGEGAVWDEDQRQLVENQDMDEIEKARRQRPG